MPPLLNTRACEQADEFLFDHFQAAAIGEPFFLEQAGQLRFALQMDLGLLVDFDVHHFLD